MNTDFSSGFASKVHNPAGRTNPKPRKTRRYLWALAGIAIGTLAARTSQFYQRHITFEMGIAIWAADMLLVLVLSLHPMGMRLGVLLSGLLLSVPCFVWAGPLFRGLLMCFAFLPFAIAAIPLISRPTAGFRARLSYLVTWMGTREVNRRPRRFNTTALLRLIAATTAFAVVLAIVKKVPAAGFWHFARWLVGGIMIFAFAGMATACHKFLTALLGITAPGLLQSPYLSRSLTEFWTKRWNPATSVLFHKFIFAPAARHSIALAFVAVFLFSAVGHALLAFMAIGRWKISLVCGAFFLVQPFFIALERRLRVRRWRPIAGWAWTMAVLAITSPLFVEPLLEIVERSWGPPEYVLWPTIAALGFVIFVDVLFSLAALASRQGIAVAGAAPDPPEPFGNEPGNLITSRRVTD